MKIAIVPIPLAIICAYKMVLQGGIPFENCTMIIVENNGKSQSVHIDLKANVPAPGTADFGWAVATSKGFLVITSHPGIGDDSTAQPPLNEYHTHYLTAAGGGPCGDSPHATSATKNEVGRLSIVDDVIWVKNVPRGLAGDLTETGFSFMLDVRGGDLCIDIVKEFPEPP